MHASTLKRLWLSTKKKLRQGCFDAASFSNLLNFYLIVFIHRIEIYNASTI